MSWRALARRHVRVFVFSPMLAIVIGSLVGSGAVVLLGAPTRLATIPEALQGLFFAVYASLFVTVPFGGVAGLGAACAVVALGRGPFRSARLVHWLVLGAGTGAALGFIGPAFVIFAFVQSHGFPWADAWPYMWPYFPAGACAGLVAGAAIGALRWWDFVWDAA